MARTGAAFIETPLASGAGNACVRAYVRPPKFRRPPRGKAEPADDGDRWRGGLHRQGHTPTWALPPTPESARQRPKRARRGQHVARDVTFASGSVRFHSIPLCDGPRTSVWLPARQSQPTAWRTNRQQPYAAHAWHVGRVVGRLAGRGRLDRADRTVGFDGNVAPFVRWLSLFSALSFPYQRSWTYNFVSYHTYVASLRNLFFPSIQKNVLSPCVRNLCAISSSGCGI